METKSQKHMLICCLSNRGERTSMGHFKEIETGFINIFVPHRVEKRSNNGRYKYNKYELYNDNIRKCIIFRHPIPIPGETTNPAYGNLKINKFVVVSNDLVLTIAKVPCQGRSIETFAFISFHGFYKSKI